MSNSDLSVHRYGLAHDRFVGGPLRVTRGSWAGTPERFRRCADVWDGTVIQPMAAAHRWALRVLRFTVRAVSA
jgi:hypothetical protein